MANMTKKTRVLAVDDEPVIGKSIAYNFDAPHRKISVAMNGHEALDMAPHQKFDLVITDHRMPETGEWNWSASFGNANTRGRLLCYRVTFRQRISASTKSLRSTR
jgi:CheY-like chemotaxis protein